MYLCIDFEKIKTMLREDTIKKFDELNLVDLYNNGETFTSLGKKYHVWYGAAKEYLIQHGVKIREDKKRPELRETPPVGQKFGQWTVISDKIKIGHDRSINWEVQCDCGRKTFRTASALKAGSTKRCKSCARRPYLRDGTLLSTIAINAYNRIINGLNTREKLKDMEFNITPKFIDDLLSKNHYCALSGIDLSFDISKQMNDQNLSIDRIDSSKGYTMDNVQLVDKKINMMKGTLSNEEFIDLCKKVAEHNK